MVLLHNADAPSFSLPGLTVLGLASPRRGARETCVWKIALAPGAPGVLHSVTREEIFVALAGEATAMVAGHRLQVRAGDTLVVPKDTQFSLANAADVPFEAIVSLPVGGQAVTLEGTFTPPWAE